MLPPLTLAAYHVQLQHIVDFRAAYDAEHWPGGVDLVVYTDRLAPGETLAVHDPDQTLPRSQASW